MSVENWAAVGIVCSTILAVAGVLFLVTRGIRRMWQLLRKVNRLLDQTLGSPGRPSLMDRVEGIETKLAEHLHWHASPGGRPARAEHQRGNDAGPAPRRR